MAGRSRYERELRRRILNVENWPDFPTLSFLDRVEKAATRALDRGTIEGNVAAILMYHQLVEEMVRLRIRETQFLLQLAVFPWEVAFPERRKETFGQLLQSLQQGVSFRYRTQLLREAASLNMTRIGVAHHLARRGSFAGIRRDALRAERHYEKAYAAFDAGRDDFRLAFKDFKKDVFDQ